MYRREKRTRRVSAISRDGFFADPPLYARNAAPPSEISGPPRKKKKGGFSVAFLKDPNRMPGKRDKSYTTTFLFTRANVFKGPVETTFVRDRHLILSSRQKGFL